MIASRRRDAAPRRPPPPRQAEAEEAEHGRRSRPTNSMSMRCSPSSSSSAASRTIRASSALRSPRSACAERRQRRYLPVWSAEVTMPPRSRGAMRYLVLFACWALALAVYRPLASPTFSNAAIWSVPRAGWRGSIDPAAAVRRPTPAHLARATSNLYSPWSAFITPVLSAHASRAGNPDGGRPPELPTFCKAVRPDHQRRSEMVLPASADHARGALGEARPSICAARTSGCATRSSWHDDGLRLTRRPRPAHCAISE